MTASLPTVNEAYQRLHESGWSIGDTAALSAADGEPRLVWLVTGTRGTHTLEARGATQAEAWAVHMTEAMGLVD